VSGGPEHFRDAESFLDAAHEAFVNDELDIVKIKLQFAQLHATLALAAATAQGIRRDTVTNALICGMWDEVLDS
jgi:hypothetical protein